MEIKEIQMLAFQMISYAGEALDCYYQAIKFWHDHELSQAEQKLMEGDEQMHACHKIQTKLVQAESNHEIIPYSLIMTHAQDHFSTASNWQRIAKLLIVEFADTENHSKGVNHE